MTSRENVPFIGSCCEGLFSRRGVLSTDRCSRAEHSLRAGPSCRAAPLAERRNRRSSTLERRRTASFPPRPAVRCSRILTPLPCAGWAAPVTNWSTAARCTCSTRGSTADHARPVSLLPRTHPRRRNLRRHAHFDHIADAPPIAARTGALIFGAPISTRYAASTGTPGAATPDRDGLGGNLHFDGFTVEPILAHHASDHATTARARAWARRSSTSTMRRLIRSRRADARLAAMLARGSFDPHHHQERSRTCSPSTEDTTVCGSTAAAQSRHSSSG